MRNMARDQRTALALSKELPVGDMLGEAYRSVFGIYRRELFIAGFLPFLIAVCIGVVKRRYGIAEVSYLDAQAMSAGTFWVFAFRLIDLIPYTLFAVAWHRLILFGPERERPLLLAA